MKILAVFGTRPEAIKMAPVIKAFKKNAAFDIKVCVTAQHRTMLDQVLNLFNIMPDYDLDIMGVNQTLSQITQLTMQRLEHVLNDSLADWVLVQGDTNTTFAASLAAFYHKISVAHIEAGLRTKNIYSPWPEEINRQLTSRIAKLHFAPTQQAKQNLIEEGVEKNNTLVVGNTVIDALLEAVAILKKDVSLAQNILKQFSFIDESKKLILVTSHRRENFGQGLEQICIAIEKLAKRNDVQIVYPVHLNPNISIPVKKLLENKENIYLIPPQDYLPFVFLMMKSYLILTDSGGVQEEAPTLGKPVLVARHITERNEGIVNGSSMLVGTSELTITQGIINLLENRQAYKKMASATNPYGDGNAAQRIVERLQDELYV